MADYGLLGGISAGLEAFVPSYLQNKRESERMAIQKKQQSHQNAIEEAHLAAQGIKLTDPDAQPPSGLIPQQSATQGLMPQPEVKPVDQGAQPKIMGDAVVSPEIQKVNYKPESQIKSEQDMQPKTQTTSGGFGIQLSPGLLNKRKLEEAKTNSELTQFDKTSPSYTAKQAYLKKAGLDFPGLDPKTQDQLLEKVVTGNFAKDRAATNAGGRDDSRTDKAFVEFQNNLDPSKGRSGALGKTQDTLNRIASVKTLLEGVGPDGLPKAQTLELASGVYNIVSRGGVAVHGMEGLVPKTAMSDEASFASYLDNHPELLKNKAFIDNLGSTLNREEQVNNSILKNAQYSKLSAYENLKKKNPETYHQILNGLGLSEEEHEVFKKNKGKLPASGTLQLTTDEDKLTYEWAKKNPNNDTAKAFIKAHGG